MKRSQARGCGVCGANLASVHRHMPAFRELSKFCQFLMHKKGICHIWTAVLIIRCKLRVNGSPFIWRHLGDSSKKNSTYRSQSVHTCEHYITCSLTLVWKYSYANFLMTDSFPCFFGYYSHRILHCGCVLVKLFKRSSFCERSPNNRRTQTTHCR